MKKLPSLDSNASLRLCEGFMGHGEEEEGSDEQLEQRRNAMLQVAYCCRVAGCILTTVTVVNVSILGTS